MTYYPISCEDREYFVWSDYLTEGRAVWTPEVGLCKLMYVNDDERTWIAVTPSGGRTVVATSRIGSIEKPQRRLI